MITSPTDDIQVNLIGGLLLDSFLDMKYGQAKLLSKWVGSYGCHVPNIDNYKTLAVYHIDGSFMFAYDSSFNLIINNLDMEHEQSKDFFNEIESKIKELKHSN